MPRNKSIIRIGNDTSQNARREIWSCPFCQTKADLEVWDEHVTKLILEPKIWKPGCVAIFSECQTCFEQSWVHHRLRDNYLFEDRYPQRWMDKLTELKDTLDKKNSKEWSESLCSGCTNLQKGPDFYYGYPLIYCIKGDYKHSGHCVSPSDGCEYFVKLTRTRKR